MVVPIGSRFKTGDVNPVSGVYIYVGHMGPGCGFRPSPAQSRIPLTLGETFPPHTHCRQAVVWELVEYA